MAKESLAMEGQFRGHEDCGTLCDELDYPPANFAARFTGVTVSKLSVALDFYGVKLWIVTSVSLAVLG